MISLMVIWTFPSFSFARTLFVSDPPVCAPLAAPSAAAVFTGLVSVAARTAGSGVLWLSFFFSAMHPLVAPDKPASCRPFSQ